MSTDIIKVEEKVSVLEKKDWNNERDLIVFKKEFEGAQNLQTAIKQFYKSFILSKIIKEEDLLKMPDINWFYISKTHNSRGRIFYVIDTLRIFNRRFTRFISIQEGGKKTRSVKPEDARWGYMGRRASFKDQSSIIQSFGGHEFIEKIKRTFPDIIESYREEIIDQNQGEERYWILNDFGQPLFVCTRDSLEFIKIELHEEEGFLRVVCPVIRGGCWHSLSFIGCSYDVYPGSIVNLDFNIGTNELIRYSPERC